MRSWIRESLSVGTRYFHCTVSISTPKNVRHVVGPSIFLGDLDAQQGTDLEGFLHCVIAEGGEWGANNEEVIKIVDDA